MYCLLKKNLTHIAGKNRKVSFSTSSYYGKCGITIAPEPPPPPQNPSIVYSNEKFYKTLGDL